MTAAFTCLYNPSALEQFCCVLDCATEHVDGSFCPYVRTHYHRCPMLARMDVDSFEKAINWLHQLPRRAVIVFLVYHCCLTLKTVAEVLNIPIHSVRYFAASTRKTNADEKQAIALLTALTTDK